MDGHPNALASSAGSTAFLSPRSGSGSSASPATSRDLYPHHGIDVETIVGAAADLAG